MKRIRKTVCMVLAVLSLVPLCGCGAGMVRCLMERGANAQKGAVSMQQDKRSYAEIARDLQDLGIGGITDELVQSLEEQSAQLPEGAIFSKTANLLSVVGMGTFGPELSSWTPARNGVYSFDMEVYDEGKIYTYFLEGVAALGEGELEFTNITEDLSRMDREAGTGPRSVSFDWNGTRYTMEMTAQQDWFDVAAARQLSKIVQEAGGDKQLYFVGDGYQSCMVFYRDAAWAREFQQKTGLPLSTLLED